MSDIFTSKSPSFQQKVKEAPLLPGCYIYKDANGKVLYVGKAKRLRNRIKSYFSNFFRVEIKIQQMIALADDIEYYTVDSEVEALILETNLIKKYHPKYNSMMTDDKNYIWVKFERNKKDDLFFPQVKIVRKKENDGAEYFGPYPDTIPAKNILRKLRRVFPYISAKHKVIRNEIPQPGQAGDPATGASWRPDFAKATSGKLETCLYFHIGLCPCGMDNPKEAHMKNFNNIKKFFRGEKISMLNELERKMHELSHNMDFENAAEMRDRIKDIKYVTANIRITGNIDDVYVEQLQKQQKQSAIDELIQFLKFPNDKLKNHKDLRIECYDISNIQGTNAVGSMVVMIDGEIKPELYRRFRIRMKNEPNDFAMHQEVLARRFRRFIIDKHKSEDSSKKNKQSSEQKPEGSETIISKNLYKQIKNLKEDESFKQKPDLLIIDGGKGQLSSTYKVLQDLDLQKDIPIVGLAKREEEIFKIREQFSSKHGLFENTFERVKLPRRSESLFLVQRIRDEAHRFAISYHRKLRSKSMI